MASHSADAVTLDSVCFHCGDPVGIDGVRHAEKSFCCNGCKIVYEILEENNLCRYYDFQANPGTSPTGVGGDRFRYLDDPAIVKQLVHFADGSLTTVSFTIPSMHCSSCVWLLENLHVLLPGILHSRVDFLKKRLFVKFNADATLRQVVELLSSIGYEPEITLASAEPHAEPRSNRTLYYRVGVAGFCFANIMLLSFPDYLSGGKTDPELARLFSFINVVLSIPVFAYSGWEYFRSAGLGLSRGIVNIDLPLALGILVLFVRSLVDIFSGAGPGFLDSMSGLVFFLLLGRLFQAKTYDSLNFERTYRSFFPLAVTVRSQGAERSVRVSDLSIGDRMILRHGDIVPADSVIVHGAGTIDYSFVTGESRLVTVGPGERVFAGGRQQGAAIELDVVRKVSQSYLTQIWNDTSAGDRTEGRLVSLSNTVGKFFTAAVLVLAVAACIFWLPQDTGRALDAFTGVLIVACPCAIALAVPFTFGSVMRVLGRANMYLKNASIVEAMARVSMVILDKTGTISYARRSLVHFEGEPLSDQERRIVASVVRNSSHPLSRALLAGIETDGYDDVTGYEEIPGGGVTGCVGPARVRLGSSSFVGGDDVRGARSGDNDDGNPTRIYLSINGVTRGSFGLSHHYREGMEELLAQLGRRFRIVLLSGDTGGERPLLSRRFGNCLEMHFEQSPYEKRDFIRRKQSAGDKVLMVGDGLNDAGALRTADVGVSVADDIAAFAPASDAIVEGSSLRKLDTMLRLSRAALRIIGVAIGISIVYNVVGLTFAVRGELSPILAAILMPLSSVTAVAVSTIAVRLVAHRQGLL